MITTTHASPALWPQSQQLVEAAAATLLDPQARQLAAAVQWWELPGLPERWPVAVLGDGPPVLLLHGFDSCGLEFRRLAPLLADQHQLIIPDLHGFGFCPRPLTRSYTPAQVLEHLEALLDRLLVDSTGPVGVIGASMGGSVALELARRRHHQISRLLLLAPAGLDGEPRPLPPLLDGLGVRFLARPGVRRGLCRTAFAAPDAPDPARGVGPAELEIASVHLATPHWGESLRRFARSGGFAGCGAPLPHQPLQVLWGQQDRILRPPQKRAARALLADQLQELADCGHLPHIDRPEAVATIWLQPLP